MENGRIQFNLNLKQIKSKMPPLDRSRRVVLEKCVINLKETV